MRIWFRLLFVPCLLGPDCLGASGIYVRLGGSLPAVPNAVERASLQGLKLLATKLQQYTPFYGPSQLPLRLRVDVEDDEGDAQRASQIYSRMIQNDEVDFLIGLQTGTQEAAIEAGNSHNILTLLTGGMSSEVASKSGPWTFTPDVQVKDIMAGTMELAGSQATPARSMATIWDAGSSFAEEVCAGATLHAQRVGMKVLDATGIADQAMMPHMRELKGMGPDLLVGCGNLRSAEQILISASSLSFIPLGLVLTAVSSRDAVRSVGAHLANYVMSPFLWEPSESVSCPVFGSAKGFAAAYRAEFNEEPLPQSAAAASGAMALLAAIQEVSSLEQNAVRQALTSRSMQTCYGLLSFDANGTRTNPKTSTQQVQPLGKDVATMDRWISADIVPLGERQLQGWPLPTWVQKEIDVYPCIPGEAVVLDNGGNATTCKQCPPGRYRTPRSVECEDCQPGTYGTAAGMSQCDLCPFGADCPGSSQLFAKPGFYRLPVASQAGTFVECKPPELCIGKNECIEAHRGILCQHCSPGYSLPLWGLKRDFCTECPSHRVAVSSITLTVFLYVLYVWLIVKGTRSASQSVRAIHSVILKIGVNYLQFAGTAFEATEFKVMVATICGESGSFLMPFIAVPERLQYPFSALISLDCILPLGSSIRPYQVEITIGLLLMPAAFFIMTLFAAIRKDCLGVLAPWVRKKWAIYKARQRARMLERGVAEDTTPQDLDILRSPSRCPAAVSAVNPSVLVTSPSSGVSPTLFKDSSPPVSPQRRGDFTPMSPRRSGGDFTPMSASGVGSPWHREEEQDSPSPRAPHTKVFVNNVAVRFVNSVIVMSFILHPVVVRILVVGFECEELDVLRHRRDLGVECKSDSHMPWLALSTAGLIVFGLGVPVSLFLALCRVRKSLYRPEIRKRYGFLYNGFELKYYYFESVYMFRKVMILLFFTAPTMYVRMVLMLFTSFGFILLHANSGPFDNRSYMCLDRLESLSLTALTATVSARLIFDIRKELSGEFFEEIVNHWTMDIFLVAGPMLMHMAFIGFAIWSLFRNTVLKHLLLKVEIWPERMSRFQKCLLGLEKHKRKAFFDEDEEGFWLDTCNLSKQEKDYLFIAMCDTLHRYMDTEQRIHPGDMAAAVKEALVRCRTARRKRAVRLEQLDREHREQKSMGRNGCLSRIIRWQRILSVSLYGADRQSELQEQETSCFENLFACLGRKVDRRRRIRGLPKKALHMEMERTHEFLPEEFFDALIPVWQEITEGQGPHLSPRECHYWPETTARPRRVRLQGVEDEEDGDEEEGRTLHGSSLRLEALLGREQPPADREASGPLESFLLRAHSGCRIDLPTLITAHDELLSENLELRKQNEALQTQVASVRRSPKKLPQSLASAASPASGWREESTIGPNAEREFSESEEIAEEDVIPTAPSSWRDAEPGSPSIVNAAAAAFAAVRSTSSHTNSPTRHVQSAGSELADLSQDVVQPSPNQLFPSRPSSRAPSQRSSPNRKTQGRLLLPIPSAAERARPWNRGNSPSKSPGSASPWRKAMRPVRNKEWSDAGGNPMPQHVPFEFSGAVRPTDPGAWPQVE